MLEPILILLALAGALALLAWVLAPLWRGAAPFAPPDPRAVALLARRQAALASLRDLDADFAAGRLPEAEYRALRATVVAEGAATLAALDRLAAVSAADSADLVAGIEAEVAALGAPSAGPSPAAGDHAAGGHAAVDHAVGDHAADEHAVARQPESRPCPTCGRPSQADARFCAGCGRSLEDADAGG